MNRPQIKNIIHTHFIQLKKSSCEISKTKNEHAIHRFRVEVKKLRAFLRLLSAPNRKRSHLKLPGSIKKMYRFLGHVRDEQLHRQRLGQNSVVNDSYFAGSSNKAQWKKQILNVEKINSEELKITGRLPLQLTENMLQHFFDTKTKDILAIINTKTFTDKELHAIRKALKDMIYISRLLYHENVSSDNIIKKGNHLDKAERLAQSLGNYNDICIALDSLSLPGISSAPEEERKVLRNLRRRWMTSKRNRRKTLIKRVITFQTDVMPDR